MRGKTAPSIIDINLLPREQRPPEVPLSVVAFGLVLAIAIIALVPLAFRAQDARNDAASMNALSDEAESHLRNLKVDLTRQRAMRTELKDSQQKLSALREQREAAQGGRRPLWEDLVWLQGWGFLPPGARLTSVSETVDGLRVEGIASGPLDAIAYADKLVNDGKFVSASIASFAPAPQGRGLFTVEVAR